ncbi:DUF6960 family protein [Hyalangium gracile]|uniref:DUF6960 family protein n=1 Tax=Hyalangium gracile TaxID=394092 RepID=UPI001CCA85FF|nr:hypothetical protein [Hyalangium gracile]
MVKSLYLIEASAWLNVATCRSVGAVVKLREMEVGMVSPGEWGIYAWSSRDQRLVHPDDFDALDRLIPYGKLLRVAGVDGQYCVLEYGEKVFRVDPQRFMPKPAPRFRIGQSVATRGADEKHGVVVDVFWHFNRGEPYYFVRFGNKVSSKRYWGEDLESG